MHLSLNNSLGKWILPTPAPFSPEATNYFSRLDTAGDTTYVDYKQPLANYIDSLVSLGGAYWDTMLSSTSFVGVGIQGVTVPLRDGMTVPTNNNFVASDLNQLTGLKGGSTKELATGILDNQLTDSNASASVYATEAATTGAHLSNDFNNGSVNLRVGTPFGYCSLRGLAINTLLVTSGVTGLIGLTRNTDTDLDGRSSQTNVTASNVGLIPRNSEIFVLSRNAAQFADSRLATYHVGPALNLATLEGLQATLLSEIRTAHTFVAVASYFSRLVAAGDTTHVAYKAPLTNYITSLVELGGAYWDTMLSATSFVGVGIEGITVPLKDGMPAITNNNFVAGDLNQLTGLKGNGSTKYLDTGTKFNDAPQNDFSMSVNATETILEGSGGYYLVWQSFVDGVSQIASLNDAGVSNNELSIRCQNRPGDIIVDQGSIEDFTGINRTSSTGYLVQYGASSATITQASQAPANQTVSVFGSSANIRTDARLATYHIGHALDLPTLRGLQATLLSEIAGGGLSAQAITFNGQPFFFNGNNLTYNG